MVDFTAAGSHGMREVNHELTLQLLCHSSAASGGVMLTAARLSPEVPHIKAFLEATIDGSDVLPAHIVRPQAMLPTTVLHARSAWQGSRALAMIVAQLLLSLPCVGGLMQQMHGPSVLNL